MDSSIPGSSDPSADDAVRLARGKQAVDGNPLLSVGGARADGAEDPFAPVSGSLVTSAKPKKNETWEPQLPASEEPPAAADIRHPKYGAAVRHWIYRDAAGAPLFAAVRFELVRDDGKPAKEILPYTYGRRQWTTPANRRRDVIGWHFKRPAIPVPVYGLDRLAARPDAQVLLCEGEKATDAAGRLFPDVVPIAAQGGGKAVDNSDWSAVAGRHVTIWPDADLPGIDFVRKATELLQEAGTASVRVVQISLTEWPNKWDLADELPPGVPTERLRELLDAAVVPLSADEIEESDPEPASRAAEIDRLSRLSGAEYGAARKRAAQLLLMGVGDLDRAIAVQKAKRRSEAEAQHRAKPAPEGGGTLWPFGFLPRSDGLYFEPGGDAAPVWICAPFSVIAETADEVGASWGLLLCWHDRNGCSHEWAMPRRFLHADGNQIAMELEHAGLAVGTAKVSHDLLKRLLSQITTSNRRRCVSRTGWHQTEAGHVYVMPGGETFGSDSTGIILQTEHVASADTTRSHGTLAEWQEHVARYAVGNHRLGLFMSAAFAGPLLDVTTEPSGGLHLHGGSQTGKTTALGCSASVWGRADTSGQIRTWRATGNGMEGVAAETCDALLSLDEIGMVDAREAGEIVYSLANESGKARAGRDGSARARRTWRTVFLSTGEVPLSVKMGERGATPMAGQDVRLANLPADAGAGLGVFQQLHGKANGAMLAVHLRAATRTYYGTAARAFLEKLAHERATDPDGLTAIIQKMRDTFLKNLAADADGQVVSVARRFSLIAAAGELARMFGVLPWEKGEAQAAATAGLKAWIAARGGTGAGEDTQAVATVQRFIELHGESRFSLLLPVSTQAKLQAAEEETTDGRQTINRVGYRRQTSSGWSFMVFPESWKSEVCRGLDPTRVAEALHAAGFLDKGDGRNWPKRHRVPGLELTRLYTVHGSILQGGKDE